MTYKVYVNGKMLTQSDNYNFAMNRGLGIAMYLNLDFINTKSKQIIDKWADGTNQIIITKN